jgi:hypothetical protein
MGPGEGKCSGMAQVSAPNKSGEPDFIARDNVAVKKA